MTQLPNLSKTRVTIPTSTATIHARGIMSPRSIRGNFPKPNRPAPLVTNNDYKTLNRQERISADSRVSDILRGANLSVIPIEDIPRVIAALKEKKRVAVLDGDYSLAQMCENTVQKLNSIIISRKNQQIKNQEIRQLQMSLNQAENTLKNMILSWNNRVDEFNRTQTNSTRRLERMQFNSLSEVDERNASNELPSKYRKPSAALLDLREKERHLVLTKRYDEATQLHKEAERLERQEVLEKKRQYVRTAQAERRQLVMMQQRDAEGFSDRWMRASEKLTNQMEKEIEQQRRVVENIRAKLVTAQNEVV